jgi:ACT domain-containing protein
VLVLCCELNAMLTGLAHAVHHLPRMSWSETECERLLKSLKHTSDLKHMTFFIETNFPTDYTAIISKPIAWITCHEKLKNNKYDTIGEIVADLRLIFSNALKYNDRMRTYNKISQMAYDSANHMSNKLEQAIDKMLLSVSDRIGRERIDMITLHREVEAKERAEEELLKARWEKDNPSTAMEVKTKILIKRTHRKRTDFEFPFDDDEDDNEESHDDTIRNAKTIFERQQKERAKMKAISLSIGIHVFEGLRQRANAKAWACRMAQKLHAQKKLAEEKLNAGKEPSKELVSISQKGDCVLTALTVESRTQVKMSLSKPLPKKAKRRVGLSAL